MENGEAAGTAATNDDRSNGIWILLLSLDPASDDPWEYRDKVNFIDSICPQKDKSMLAPRLAMLCKGTAWAQVKALDASLLADANDGVKVLLQALSTWDEAAELQTYEKCEKALFTVVQKPDETTTSCVNRLAVAFHEMGETVTLKEIKAFIMLCQSALTSEYKRKVITISGGTLDSGRVEQAMRTLSTKILTTGMENRKKIYSVNFTETEDHEESAHLAGEEYNEDQVLSYLAKAGDEDAIFITEYEDQISELVREIPELSSCFSAYTAARQRLRERAKSRGFWPAKGGEKPWQREEGEVSESPKLAATLESTG